MEQNKAPAISRYNTYTVPRKHFTVLSLGVGEVRETTPSMSVSPLFFPLNARTEGGGWAQFCAGLHKQHSLKSSIGETSHFRVIFLPIPLFSFYYYRCPKNNRIRLRSTCLFNWGKDYQTERALTQGNSENMPPLV
jgi:hypothetical protein